MVTLDQIRQAQERLKGVATRTPLLKYPSLVDTRTLYLKPENLQPIGSFKLRGAYNKISSLTDDERHRGVIASPSGNPAHGVASPARAIGEKPTIVMPGTAPPNKLKGAQALGAQVAVVGPASSERKARAEELA